MNYRILMLAACVASGAAGAQQVYRCNSTYSQVPCPGAAQLTTAPDPTSGRDAARARAAAQVDAQRAAVYERARLQQEKDAPRAIVMAPPVQAAASAPKKAAKERKPEVFKATVPGSANKK